MRVFLTGATGFIGSALIPDLIKSGHQVLGLARSDAGAKSLQAAGVQRIAAISRTWKACAAVRPPRTASFTPPSITTSRSTRPTVRPTGAPSKLSARCWLTPAALWSSPPGPGWSSRPAAWPPKTIRPLRLPHPRSASEEAAAVRVTGRTRVGGPPPAGPRSDSSRPGQLRDRSRCEKGVSAYVGDGRNRWPAVHLLDAAHLSRLALEKGCTWKTLSRGRRRGRLGCETSPTQSAAA